MITKYGIDVLLKYCFFITIVGLCCFFFLDNIYIRYILLGVLGVLGIFIINFFRDPERIPPDGDKLVIAPADGRVVTIKEVLENEFLKQTAIQISIFMSPIDVHVNRFPISGIVTYFKYIPGDYIVAFDEKSSERNERTHIGVEDNGYKVFLKQIAGVIARRIVSDIKVGQCVNRGERFGMIKFGSRVDVLLPVGTEINVKLNERVFAGRTIIASYLKYADDKKTSNRG